MYLKKVVNIFGMCSRWGLVCNKFEVYCTEDEVEPTFEVFKGGVRTPLSAPRKGGPRLQHRWSQLYSESSRPSEQIAVGAEGQAAMLTAHGLAPRQYYVVV